MTTVILLKIRQTKFSKLNFGNEYLEVLWQIDIAIIIFDELEGNQHVS